MTQQKTKIERKKKMKKGMKQWTKGMVLEVRPSFLFLFFSDRKR